MDVSIQDGAAISWEQTGKPGAQQQGHKDRGVSEGGGGIALQTRPWCGAYAVTSDAFEPALVGAKSLNTLKLKVNFHRRAASLSPITVPKSHSSHLFCWQRHTLTSWWD